MNIIVRYAIVLWLSASTSVVLGHNDRPGDRGTRRQSALSAGSQPFHPSQGANSATDFNPAVNQDASYYNSYYAMETQGGYPYTSPVAHDPYSSGYLPTGQSPYDVHLVPPEVPFQPQTGPVPFPYSVTQGPYDVYDINQQPAAYDVYINQQPAASSSSSQPDEHGAIQNQYASLPPEISREDQSQASPVKSYESYFLKGKKQRSVCVPEMRGKDCQSLQISELKDACGKKFHAYKSKKIPNSAKYRHYTAVKDQYCDEHRRCMLHLDTDHPLYFAKVICEGNYKNGNYKGVVCNCELFSLPLKGNQEVSKDNEGNEQDEND